MAGTRGVTSSPSTREVADALNQILAGKLNAQSTLTLTANAASTTITDPRCGDKSVILLMPTTANAAGALATTYASIRTKGSFTLTHANTATVDRIFAYAIFGG